MLPFKELGAKHPKIKYCKQLGNPSFRKKEGKLLLEGLHLVEEALKEKISLEILFLSSEILKTKRYKKVVRMIAIEKMAEKCFVVSDRVLKSIAHTQSPQGIVAVSSLPSYNLKKSILSAESPFLLVLDGIQDPGNMGTLIRTAAAAGLTGVVSLPGTVDYSNLKVMRASAGAFFRVPLFYFEEFENLLTLLQEKNFSLVGGDPHKGLLYNEANLKAPTALFIGNENRGLSGFCKERLDYSLNIPLKKAESLNAAVAASIIVFEALRQRNFLIE